MEFDVSAVCSIVEYSFRAAERQDKLSTRFTESILISFVLITRRRASHACGAERISCAWARYRRNTRNMNG